MSRSKKIVVLLFILFVTCGVTFGVGRYEEQKEQIKNSDKTILELPGRDVTSLSWEYESEEFAFHKDKQWIYDEDEAFPVDEDKIMELLENAYKYAKDFHNKHCIMFTTNVTHTNYYSSFLGQLMIRNCYINNPNVNYTSELETLLKNYLDKFNIFIDYIEKKKLRIDCIRD